MKLAKYKRYALIARRNECWLRFTMDIIALTRDFWTLAHPPQTK